MIRLGRACSIFCIILFSGGWSFIDRPSPEVEDGNRAFAKGLYAKALASYERALEVGTEPAVFLNRGLALYRMALQVEGEEASELFARAEGSLSRVIASERAAIRSRGLVALGNVYLREQRVAEAMAAYRRALREDPENGLARHNLELALRLEQSPQRSPAGSGAEGHSSPGESDEGGHDATAAVDSAADRAESSEADPPEGVSSPEATDPDQGSSSSGEAASGDGGPEREKASASAADLRDLARKLDALERRSAALQRELVGRRRGTAQKGPDW